MSPSAVIACALSRTFKFAGVADCSRPPPARREGFDASRAL